MNILKNAFQNRKLFMVNLETLLILIFKSDNSHNVNPVSKNEI